MKFKIIRPIGDRIGWIFISSFLSCFIILIFYLAKDNLNFSMLCISYTVILFVLIISGLAITIQIIPGFIEIKNNELVYCPEIFEKKRFIPFADIKKIVILEFKNNKVNKIVTNNEEIYVNNYIQNVDSFMKELDKYIEKIKD